MEPPSVNVIDIIHDREKDTVCVFFSNGSYKKIPCFSALKPYFRSDDARVRELERQNDELGQTIRDLVKEKNELQKKYDATVAEHDNFRDKMLTRRASEEFPEIILPPKKKIRAFSNLTLNKMMEQANDDDQKEILELMENVDEKNFRGVDSVPGMRTIYNRIHYYKNRK